MPTWDAGLYLKFDQERTQPARDLLARVELDQPRRIVDLGSGPGNSTALLHQRWPEADLLGIDLSAEMIAAAARDHPWGRWLQADAASWKADQPVDLLFSNAALQWLPNHRTLFPRLFEQLARPGVLAVQMPAHLDSAVHRHMLEIADDPAWRARLAAAGNAIEVHRPAFYYDLLRPLCGRLDLWETEYIHALAGPAAIVEWMRGTGLRPFLDPLGEEAEREWFLERLLAAVVQSYPRQADGRVLFPFRRLFLVAYR